jgi:sugar lactone lactonase YvrE
MHRILKDGCFLLALAIFSSCSNNLFTAKPPMELMQAWASDNTLRTPESALYNEQENVIYVSNINKMSGVKKDGDGFISKLNTKGETENLYWVTGLNDPKGMALYNNVLYVSDVNEVVAIAVQTGAILGRYEAENAKFLNDVAVDNSGNVYITDSEQKRIYQLRNGRVTTWMENTDREKPNGIFLEENRIILAFMSSGQVRFLNTETKNWTNWAEGIKSADGIASIGSGDYLVSSWHGEIYLVNSAGKKWLIHDTKAKNINAADISYASKPELLLVPTFYDNRLVAYRLHRR